MFYRHHRSCLPFFFPVLLLFPFVQWHICASCHHNRLSRIFVFYFLPHMFMLLVSAVTFSPCSLAYPTHNRSFLYLFFFSLRYVYVQGLFIYVSVLFTGLFWSYSVLIYITAVFVRGSAASHIRAGQPETLMTWWRMAEWIVHPR